MNSSFGSYLCMHITGDQPMLRPQGAMALWLFEIFLLVYDKIYIVRVVVQNFHTYPKTQKLIEVVIKFIYVVDGPFQNKNNFFYQNKNNFFSRKKIYNKWSRLWGEWVMVRDGLNWWINISWFFFFLRTYQHYAKNLT